MKAVSLYLARNATKSSNLQHLRVIFGDTRWQLRLHEIKSGVVSGCVRLVPGASDALTHHIIGVVRFRGLWLLVWRSSGPQVKCFAFSLGLFFCLLLCLPNFVHCRPINTPKSRCRPLQQTARQKSGGNFRTANRLDIIVSWINGNGGWIRSCVALISCQPI